MLKYGMVLVSIDHMDNIDYITYDMQHIYDSLPIQYHHLKSTVYAEFPPFSSNDTIHFFIGQSRKDKNEIF